MLNNDINPILELHWSSSETIANKQEPMPNRKYSIPFWKGVADNFKYNTGIIFDVFNEPFPDNNTWDSDEGWRCLKEGGKYNLKFKAFVMKLIIIQHLCKIWLILLEVQEQKI
jgi:hypothetical protein